MSNLKSKINKPQSLRVLIVEDSEDDVLLIIRELKKGGYNPVYERVETEKTMSKALREKPWDVILCDYKLPKLNATSAIAVLKETNIDIPLLIVSGAIGEETAVECMRLGAHDYIMKNNLSRLCQAIARELEETEVRVQRKQAEQKLRESEAQYRLLAEHMTDIVWMMNLDLNVTWLSPSAVKARGFSVDEIAALSLDRQLTPESLGKAVNWLGKLMRLEKDGLISEPDGILSRELEFYCKDGRTIVLDCTFQFIRDEQGKATGILAEGRDITALHQSEGKYRNILENIEDGYYEVDLKGNFTFFNASMCRILGYPQEEMMGMNNRQFTDKENAKKLFKTFNEVYRTGEPAKEFDWQIIRKDGTERYIEVSVSLQKNSSGKPIGFRGISRDITSRKQAEETLRQSEERFRILFEQAADSILLLEILPEGIPVIRDANSATFRLLGYERDEMIGRPVSFIEAAPDASKVVDERRRDILSEMGAIFQARHRCKDGTILDFECSATEMQIGSKTFALSVERDITKRKRAEEALKESENKYRLLADNANDVIFVLDMNLNYTYISPSVKILRGYEPAEVLKKPTIETLTPSSWDLAMRNVSEVMELEKSGRKDIPISRALQLEMVRKDGTTVWTEVEFSFIRDEDQQPVSILGVARDITERKRAEEALLESEAQYRWLSEHITDSVWLLDMNLKPTYQSPSMEKLTGFTHEELMELPMEKRVTPESLKLALELFLELIPRIMTDSDYNPLRTLELEYYCKDGTILWTENKLSGIRDENGKPVSILAEVRDITERKQAEEKLRKSEENFRRSLDDSSLGVRIVTAEGETLYANQAALEIYGYDSIEELKRTPLKEHYTPESYVDFQIRKEKRGRGEFGPSEYEISIVRKNGEIRHIQVFRKEVIWNGARQFQIIYHDITKRQQAEELLRRSEEKYRNIIETMQEGYFENDLAGNFTFVNDAECRNLGYPKEELIGMNNRRYQDETNAQKTYQLFKRLFRTGEPVKAVDVEIIRKNGMKGFNEASVSLIRDAEGKPIGFRGISRDVTERKQAENSLQESEERYKALFDRSLDLVYITDFEGRFIDANAVALNRLGYTREEIHSLNIASLLSEDQLPLAVKTIQEIRETGAQKFPTEFRLLHKDGTRVYVETKGSIVMSNGTPVAIQSIARDVTERKQAEEERKQSFERMRKALGATVHSISVIVEMKDPYTSGHQQRVSDLARSIATEMGLSADQRDFIRTASAIHDIGKISIPTEILSKPTKLSDLEFNLIKTHAQSGYDILKDIEFPWPVADVVLQHHERLDGSGYPQGLKGDDILLEARILAIADVVEAIASHRPYRPALGIDLALEEISRNKGILYDAAAADACLKLFREKGYTLVLKNR